jgi:hypothetical protein
VCMYTVTLLTQGPHPTVLKTETSRRRPDVMAAAGGLEATSAVMVPGFPKEWHDCTRDARRQRRGWPNGELAATPP